MRPVRRTRSPRGQGEALRAEILDAAEALLVETQSEEAVSIRAVAHRVGVTPPSIYRHFEDKASLMFAVCHRQFERLDVQLRTHLATERDPVEAVMACGRAYIRFGLEHPETYRIMFMGHWELTPEQYRDELHSHSGAFVTLVETVRAAADAGRLRPGVDVMTASLSLWAHVHGLVSLRIAKPSFPWPDLDEHIDLETRTIGAALFT